MIENAVEKMMFGLLLYFEMDINLDLETLPEEFTLIREKLHFLSGGKSRKKLSGIDGITGKQRKTLDSLYAQKKLILKS